MIGPSPQHDAVQSRREMRAHLAHLRHAAIENDGQIAMVALQAVHIVVLQRWNFPILLGGQPREDRGARVHDERRDARARHHGGEVREKFVVVARIDTDAALHRDG